MNTWAVVEGEYGEENPARRRLVGKRALVTGAASGIGAEVVRRFSDEGATVIGADLHSTPIAMDVRSRESVDGGIREAVETLGGLDIVVCNAGRPIVGAVHELDEEDWDDGLATNLKSVYLVARAAWSELVASRGSILCTASAVGVWGSSGQGAYCASKAGVVMLTKCLALDGARFGIRANCVCPGFTNTPLMERFLSDISDTEKARASAVALHPLGRLGEPKDVANAFVYLASDEASWITGHALIVDGGLTLGIRPA